MYAGNETIFQTKDNSNRITLSEIEKRLEPQIKAKMRKKNWELVGKIVLIVCLIAITLVAVGLVGYGLIVAFTKQSIVSPILFWVLISFSFCSLNVAYDMDEDWPIYRHIIKQFYNICIFAAASFGAYGLYVGTENNWSFYLMMCFILNFFGCFGNLWLNPVNAIYEAVDDNKLKAVIETLKTEILEQPGNEDSKVEILKAFPSLFKYVQNPTDEMKKAAGIETNK